MGAESVACPAPGGAAANCMPAGMVKGEEAVEVGDVEREEEDEPSELCMPGCGGCGGEWARP